MANKQANGNKSVTTRPTLTADHLNLRKFQAQGAEHFLIHFKSDLVPEDFYLLTDSWQLPSKTTEVVNMNWFNSTVKIAGRTTFGSGSAVFKDVIDYDAAMALEQWCSIINDLRTGTRGYKEDYSTTVYCDVFSPNGKTYRRWVYEGVWISSLSYTDLSYDSPGFVKINVTFEYDRAYPEELPKTNLDD